MQPNEFSTIETWMMVSWITTSETQMLLWDDKAKFYAQLEIQPNIEMDESPIETLSKDMEKHYFSEADAVVSASIYNDLIRAGLRKVDFDEVADTLINRYRP